MKEPRSQTETPEDDALWELLGNAQPPEASDFFSRNVMREVRLAEQISLSFWQRLVGSLRRSPVVAGVAAAVMTLVAILGFTLVPNPESHSSELARATTNSEQSLTNYLDEELLLVAADEPDLFSDEEVIAMLF